MKVDTQVRIDFTRPNKHNVNNYLNNYNNK